MIFHGTIIESINPRAEFSTRGLRKGDRSEQFFIPRIQAHIRMPFSVETVLGLLFAMIVV
jgi:hypothetical protein